ncbi:MAG: shikimate kinase [Amaricoccus sp.]
MGAGKSSVGRRLASLLGVPSTTPTRRSSPPPDWIPEIFAAAGERGFRGGERCVVARLLAGQTAVIATGGGGLRDPDTRATIRPRATSVWLRAEVDVLWERVRERRGRPPLEVDDPRAVLADLHRRRAPIYAEADIVVDSHRDSRALDVAHATLKALSSSFPCGGPGRALGT